MKNSPETLAKRNALRKLHRETIDRSSFPAAIKRVCIDCGKLKLCPWTSSFSQTGKPEYRRRCQRCHNDYLNRRRSANRNRTTQLALLRKMKAKKRCVDYLGGSCSRCGYAECIKALTFHHRVPAEKSFDISQKQDFGWKTLVAELDKCDLLCFNCHMAEHCTWDTATHDLGFCTHIEEN